MFTADVYQVIVREGLRLLIEEKSYTQKEIFEKLKVLNFKVSKASLSNLRKEQRPVSSSLLKKTGDGLLKILAAEFCLAFDEKQGQFIAIENCKPYLISTEPVNTKTIITPAYHIYDGRLDVPEKIAFYKKAKIEVIELGIRLRNFKDYFHNKREGAFHDPLRSILENGVNFKCYVLNPESSLGARYFQDRARVQAFEKDAMKDSPEIIKELQEIFRALNREGHKGRMELYLYDHFPYFHSTVIDGHTEQGQLIISSYLYGVTRANTPVIDVAYRQNKSLYKKYWRSVQAMISAQITPML